ncbi:hypothetical protein EMPS_03747 [Entomortierella parvispora]|uniref:Uncharacterized protein n=1 Tax=Entomortierella parvispora TaxID=205924 RepID=A0A9P3H7D1_9FUNG|nr:hypothetical protein EMPS_03747 [Entomortierella parvispora]
MDNASILSSGFMERAICLPEVLTYIFSWLKNERRTIRSLRLVSKEFFAMANQFFRVHLAADYAIEHNCIQEAPTIIGGLTFTFPRIITEEADALNRHLGLEPQNSVVSLAFCSLVARNCVHLEKVKIVLEGPHSDEVSQLLSCLFSQNPQSAAAFRIKSLEIGLGFKFVESVVQDVQDSNLPDSCTGLLPTMDYIPTESPFSGLEELRLIKRFMVQAPALYRILQLKICPEIAAATSFLGPVYWNRAEREARVPKASSTAKPSLSLRIFDIVNSDCSVDDLYALKEQAPMLEEVGAATICNMNESITDEAALALDSTRAPRTLRLKKMTLLTISDRYLKLLLCQLLDLSVLESFVTGFINGRRPSIPTNNNGTAPFTYAALNELFDEMGMISVSERSQERFLQELAITSYDRMLGRVDWLQKLKNTPWLYQLERLSLPLNVDGFLDMFDSSNSMITVSESGMDPVASSTVTTASTCTTTTSITTVTQEEDQDERVVARPQHQPQLPFPACSSLLTFRLSGGDAIQISDKSLERFADYLVRYLPRIKHLVLPTCTLTDFTFLNTIAPQALHPQLGLNRLESLLVRFEFLSLSELHSLPKSEHAMELLQRRDNILAKYPMFRPGEKGYDDYLTVEAELKQERQKMLLEARPIQVHEDRIEQFLAFLDRFQRRKSGRWSMKDDRGDKVPACSGVGSSVDIEGLRQIIVYQTGMPNAYVEKLKARVASQFPRLDFTVSSSAHHPARRLFS